MEPSAACGVYSSVTFAHQTVPCSVRGTQCWKEVLGRGGVSLPGIAGFGVQSGGVEFLHPVVFVLLMVMEEAPQTPAGREEKSTYFHRHCKVKCEEFGGLNMLILLSLEP